MDCPECDATMVVFPVPADHRDVAPGEDAAAVCPRCLALVGADPEAVPTEPDFGRIVESFPDGEAGAAMAVAVGLLVESLALNRQAVLELFERVSDAGVDPWLLLERLDASPTVQSGTDLGRARRQLDQLS